MEQKVGLMAYLRMYTWWTFTTILGLIGRVLNFPLAPIVVLFASKDGWLPKYLWWFQTPDNSLDGDDGWKTLHAPYKNPTTKFQIWVNRWRWLWRNCLYGFSYSVSGFEVKEGWTYWSTGPEDVGNRPLREGLVKRWFLNGDGRLYFQYYYIKRRNEVHCWRNNLGWKLWNNPATYVGEHKQHVFSPSFTQGWSDHA